MTNDSERSRSKEPVTIRLDPTVRAALQDIALKEGRSVSALIDLSVREFLGRRAGGVRLQNQSDRMKVRYASLPDTAVLYSFQRMATARFDEVAAAVGLPELEFSPRRSDWRSLPTDVFSGEADLVEAVNWLPIYWHMRRGRTSPPLDNIGPYLQVFVGHGIFVRCDYLMESGALTEADLSAFLAFRNAGSTGRELSLRSLVAWASQSAAGADGKRVAEALAKAWSEVVVGCQMGTDFHIAVERVRPILAHLAGRPESVDGERPITISAVDDVDSGHRDFLSGQTSAFIGGLLQTADLLAQDPPMALLLAGPADLRVPSLNTLAGEKGMFSDPSAERGKAVLALWAEAVRWFRDDVVGAGSSETLKQLVSEQFANAKERSFETNGNFDRKIDILHSLMQSWVRWFESPEEAKAFISEDGSVAGPRGKYNFEDLVNYYQDLCELLNPSLSMTRPDLESEREVALWKFPILAARSGGGAVRRREA